MELLIKHPMDYNEKYSGKKMKKSNIKNFKFLRKTTDCKF